MYEARRWDLWLVNGTDEFVRTLIEQQYRAQAADYEARFPYAQAFVIEKTGTACGRLLLDFSQDVYVVDLAILPEAQGKAIGTTVLQALQQVAAAIPAPVSLSTHAMNAPARALYRRLGFQPSGADVGPMHLGLQWCPPSLHGSAAASVATGVAARASR
ncbi:GNAT family N-acetyltransferase [Rhodovibrio sodomensis]|uniref:GNAT family N-acetyltransferase n=1 Tax=Rhodovibrio sodomensis TaxID=1088 RepID=UPI001904A67B|nr:GNAT family N-acetyltransferase [Rhodovibrio sodomensis]